MKRILLALAAALLVTSCATAPEKPLVAEKTTLFDTHALCNITWEGNTKVMIVQGFSSRPEGELDGLSMAWQTKMKLDGIDLTVEVPGTPVADLHFDGSEWVAEVREREGIVKMSMDEYYQKYPNICLLPDDELPFL